MSCQQKAYPKLAAGPTTIKILGKLTTKLQAHIQLGAHDQSDVPKIS